MNKKQKLLIGFLFAVLIAVLGCSAFQDVITPAYIDEDTITYSGEEPTMFTPWTSLWDLKRIERATDYVHFNTQKEYSRFLEDDSIRYKYLKDALLEGAMSAEELRNNIFSPQGPLGLLLAAGPALGIGLMLSKPSDKKKITELETKLNGGK